MKKILPVLLAVILLTSCSKNYPSEDELSVSSNTIQTENPTVETYTATISAENYMETVNYWEITNVYAEGTFISDGLPLRVLYTTSGSRATMLKDFDMSEYPNIGAYTDNGDGTFSHDPVKLQGTGSLSETEDEFGYVYTSAGSYYDLPDGSWFFGNTDYSTSFFVIVNNDEAAQNGTVPTT